MTINGEEYVTVDQVMQQLRFERERQDRAVAAERERCAKIAEEHQTDRSWRPALAGREIAAKIRSGE